MVNRAKIFIYQEGTVLKNWVTPGANEIMNHYQTGARR